MDDTRELKLERRESPAARIQAEEEARRESLAGIARTMRRGADPRAVASAALDGILDLLDFERGFVFLSAAGDPLGEGLEPGRPRPLAARARRGAAGDLSDVRNPEFAVSHSVIKRALASRQPVTVPDCLLQPAPGMAEQHRAVLCRPLDLAPRPAGVLYLDRGLGGPGVGEGDLSLLEEICERCEPILAAACLAAELASVQSGVGAPPGPGAGESAPRSTEDEEGEAVEPETIPSFHGIIGRDEKLQKIYRVVEKVKDGDLSVCIFGESGTGKELLARAIHEASARKDRTFVAENCGAIAENLLESELFGHVKGAFTGADEDRKGLFELANGGTLFLDEIGDMSEGMQRKLLRVLQEGLIRPIGGKQTSKVNVRVICASNRDLRHLVQKGEFRADLYYRLNVITLELPPLRDRPGDIPLLVHHFAAEVSEEEGVRRRFSESAMKALCQYPWPGNVRELRNVIRRVMITCPHRVIARKDVMPLLSVSASSPRSGQNMERDDKDLLLRVPARESFHEIIEECERVVLLNALNQFSWNKSKVTKALRIPRQSLYNKIAKFRLERSWGEGSAPAGDDAP
jgi:transcriptional regulator with GAF, ATPase, and Fis domain